MLKLSIGGSLVQINVLSFLVLYENIHYFKQYWIVIMITVAIVIANMSVELCTLIGQIELVIAGS